MSRILNQKIKPPLYLQPPFWCTQWHIDKGVMIEPAITDCSTDFDMFTAGPGTIMTYKKHPWFYTHSLTIDGHITNDGSSYQFKGGERVILCGLRFIGYVLPGRFFQLKYKPLELTWQVLIESYLLNELEYYDLLYE